MKLTLKQSIAVFIVGIIVITIGSIPKILHLGIANSTMKYALIIALILYSVAIVNFIRIRRNKNSMKQNF